ncbi:MAG: redoxin domain-containing protein [Bacteroidales bacterium]|nr:redoxin domain-containing protein [Bacteroidales bacterium]
MDINHNGLKVYCGLLDFWASWYGSCRDSFKDLKKGYSKYKDKGFEVYSVSGDDSRLH